MLGWIDEALLRKVFGRFAARVTARPPVWFASQCFYAALALFLIGFAATVLTWLSGAAPDPVWVAGNAVWVLVLPVIVGFLRIWLRVTARGPLALAGFDLRLRGSRRFALLALPVFVPWGALFGVPADLPFLARCLAWFFFTGGLYFASAAAPAGGLRR